MSDTPSATTHELLRTAAVAVDSLPGVARLEPTLMNALRRLRIARTQEARPAATTTYFSTDGIRLTRRRNALLLPGRHPPHTARQRQRRPRGHQRQDIPTSEPPRPGRARDPAHHHRRPP